MSADQGDTYTHRVNHKHNTHTHTTNITRAKICTARVLAHRQRNNCKEIKKSEAKLKTAKQNNQYLEIDMARRIVRLSSSSASAEKGSLWDEEKEEGKRDQAKF